MSIFPSVELLSACANDKSFALWRAKRRVICITIFTRFYQLTRPYPQDHTYLKQLFPATISDDVGTDLLQIQFPMDPWPYFDPKTQPKSFKKFKPSTTILNSKKQSNIYPNDFKKFQKNHRKILWVTLKPNKLSKLSQKIVFQRWVFQTHLTRTKMFFF